MTETCPDCGRPRGFGFEQCRYHGAQPPANYTFGQVGYEASFCDCHVATIARLRAELATLRASSSVGGETGMGVGGTTPYPELAPWDLEPHYAFHVGAMTEFALHSKHDIAIQLAWRDQRFQAHARDLQQVRAELLRSARAGWDSLRQLAIAYGAHKSEEAADKALKELEAIGGESV